MVAIARGRTGENCHVSAAVQDIDHSGVQSRSTSKIQARNAHNGSVAGSELTPRFLQCEVSAGNPAGRALFGLNLIPVVAIGRLRASGDPKSSTARQDADYCVRETRAA